MDLIELSPLDIHFADKEIELDPNKKVSELKPEFIESVNRFGVVDPVVVYLVRNIPNLYKVIKKTFPCLNFCDCPDYWLWRGTKRLRAARYLRMVKIKAIVMDEAPLDFEAIQKLYKKPIQVFLHPTLSVWDIKGLDESADKHLIY